MTGLSQHDYTETTGNIPVLKNQATQAKPKTPSSDQDKSNKSNSIDINDNDFNLN